MSEISARCFLFVGNISATICKNLIFKIFYLVRKVFLICAKSDRYIRNLFTQVSGINPKKNKSIGELVKQVDFAIVEECKINEDIHQCSGQVTCNIAKIINDIRNNKAI